MDVYGALLNVLYLGDRKSPVEQSASVTFDAGFVSQLDLNRVGRNKSLDERWSVLTRFGPELVELLARDSCDGPDFVKVFTFYVKCTIFFYTLFAYFSTKNSLIFFLRHNFGFRADNIIVI